MDINGVSQIIGSLGFPIASSVGLFWYIVKDQSKMREVLNNNTLAITKLTEKIGN